MHQAEALRDWVPTVLPADTDAVVMVGDYNSYGKEDPLQVLFNAGYSDAEQHFELNKYSYSFSGLSGSLDHVLINNAALARATGADIWNINSPRVRRAGVQPVQLPRHAVLQVRPVRVLRPRPGGRSG